MQMELVFILMICILLGLLLAGQWIAFSLGSVAVAAFMLFLEGRELLFPMIVFGKIASFHLFAMPLFLLMGEILLLSGIGKDIIEGISPMFARLRGGVLYTTIATNGLFAAMCGSSIAAIGALGPSLIPELAAKGYDKRIALGTLATAGTLAVMIPPSMGLIFYGIIADQSIGTLFIAAIIPGIVYLLLLMATTFFWVSLKPALVPPKSEVGFKFALEALLKLWPLMLLIVIVLGSIYGGLCTATEAGAIGVVGASIIGFLKKRMSWRTLVQALRNTSLFMGVVGMLVAGALSFSYVFNNAGLVDLLSSWLGHLPGNSTLKMLQLIGIYFLLGLFMDPPCMTLLSVPLILPFVIQQGFDPVWFGIFQTMCTELGVITPPVGANLYVVQTLTGEDLTLIAKGTVPYWITCIVMLILLVLWPGLVTWLPSKAL